MTGKVVSEEAKRGRGRPGVSKDKIEAAQILYAFGWSPIRLADALSLSHATVYKMVRTFKSNSSHETYSDSSSDF